jgi:hypothetical protein
MIQKIPFKFALSFFLTLLSSVFIFHFLVILKIIPYTIVWAGKIENDTQMYQFESVSVLINVILFSAILIKGQIVPWNVNSKIIQVILYIFVVIFALNTIGNLFAKMSLETYIFTPLTFISAFLCLRIALEKSK